LEIVVFNNKLALKCGASMLRTFFNLQVDGHIEVVLTQVIEVVVEVRQVLKDPALDEG
jgi:hypothetical protein